ncbi:hypothetical protein M0R45_007529 [Rubus argutus]|uniref:Uncharacterized protein n=1 Tax=Rubus argutus TaxID=59490 RepID=A0AAW1XXY6_RUBAR
MDKGGRLLLPSKCCVHSPGSLTVWYIWFYVYIQRWNVYLETQRQMQIETGISDFRVLFAYLKALIPHGIYQSTKRNCQVEYVNVDPNNILCVYDLELVNQDYNYLSSFIWANDKTVQSALHVAEGSIKVWVRCNHRLRNSYSYDVSSSVGYHRNFTTKGYRVLIYR